jgi:DNA-binding transcriptional ArsR family regulator
MPAPEVDILVAPARTIQFDLAPAHNAFHSLLLLLQSDKVSGLSGWVTDTVSRMTEEELFRHRLVLNGLYYAAAPRRSWPSFTSYVDHLEALDPIEVRQRLLDEYTRYLATSGPEARTPPDWERILASAEAFVDFVRSCFEAKHVDPSLEREAYRYVSDPPAMQALIAGHLRHMWRTYLSDEWRRVSPMLQDAVAAFSEVDYSQMSNHEVTTFVTSRDLKDHLWFEKFETAEGLLFIPSAHVGPYVGKVRVGDRPAVVFGARLPEGAELKAPDLSRSEILVRLSALADESRLRILQLVGQEGELRSQDMMDRLALSQSAASRHLSQLSANGFLTARRCEGAKCYRLNADRIEDTLKAVSGFLIGPARR